MYIEKEHNEKNEDEAKQIPKDDLTLEEQFREDYPD